MIIKRKSESGQAIILIVIGLVALLGFTALAIDGGMVYSDRRNAQNASDSAALAGALQKGSGQSDATITLAVQNSLSGNGFDPSQAHISISPYNDVTGHYWLVNVVMTTTTRTSLAQVFFGGEMRNVVTAIARVRLSQPVMPGMAIVAMGNCEADGGFLIGGQGGGNDGGATTFDGGMFLNTPGDNGCAIDPPSAGTGINADPDYGIWSVGGDDYAGGGNISPLPVHTGVNGGYAIDDPMADLPEPQCTVDGHKTGGGSSTVYYPGRWNGAQINEGTLMPGIYCISGDVSLSGNAYFTGQEVVLYFRNGGMSFTGNAYLQISAPFGDSPDGQHHCLGNNGDPTASCTYWGIAIFSARNNTSTIDIRGNGTNAVTGMVYALNGTVGARGGGNSENDAVIIGQLIAKNVDLRGGADCKVTYRPDVTHKMPTRISLQR